MSRIVSIDTETTGTDLYHGCAPYFVTACETTPDGDTVTYWGPDDWQVNPLDRTVSYPPSDVNEIRALIDAADTLVFQNTVFDVKALSVIGITKFPWHKVRDTLLAGHLLSSNSLHGLDALSVEYLGEDISHHETAVQKATEACRRWCRSHRPDWMIAERGLPCMPSAKESVWKADMWLPRVVSQDEEAREYFGEQCDGWDTLLELYANEDSQVTLALWPKMEKEIRRRGLWEIYLERLKLLPITYEMESRGITVNHDRLRSQRAEFVRESGRLACECEQIASSYGYTLSLPRSGRNQSLNTFVFDVMGLPVIAETEKGNPAFDADVKSQYEATLPHDSREHKFIVALNKKSKCDTAISYCDQYERFWLPSEYEGYRVLHPKANCTGTHTLRWSFANPNSANLSKQKDEKTGDDYNLRRSFGPAPGRVHYSFDGSNVELRIPVFEAEEWEMMDVFLHPERPPYYGSYHLVIFDTLHPKLFAEHGAKCKTLFEATWYQWGKNYTFCRQYGGGEELADATARVAGACKITGKRFPKVSKLSEHYLELANRHGYVETIPDRLVNSKRGYPLNTERGWGGKVKPTLPFCYHVSGTAMQWMNTVMVVVHEILTEWRRKKKMDAWIVNQVHDEIILDFPAEKFPGQHRPFIETVKSEMEKVGDRVGVPIPVTAERHDESWAVGVAV